MEQQPTLAVAQAPSFCRLCNVEMRGLSTWRAHAKSEAHVRNLQLKVKETGTSEEEREGPHDKSQRRRGREHGSSRRVAQTLVEDDEGESDSSQGADTDDTEDTFHPGQCLFCASDSVTLDANTHHMHLTHGFQVPYQDCLAPDTDLETVVWYLHLLIYRYHACIAYPCQAGRSTVEAIQQHMLDRGHCRFDVSPDTEQFYEMPGQDEVARDQLRVQQSYGAGEDVSIRLPSGKMISHRRSVDSSPDMLRRPPHRRIQTPPERRRLQYSGPVDEPRSASSPSSSRELTTVASGDRDGGGRQVVRSSEAILAAQLSRLQVAGVRVQQQEEQRKRHRLEQATNSTAMTHFRVDAGDGRVSRKFCR